MLLTRDVPGSRPWFPVKRCIFFINHLPPSQFWPIYWSNAPPCLSNLSISTFKLLQWLPHFPFINLSMIQAMIPMPYSAPNPSSAMKNVKHQFSFCCVNPSLKLQFSSAVPHSAFLMQSFFFASTSRLHAIHRSWPPYCHLLGFLR